MNVIVQKQRYKIIQKTIQNYIMQNRTHLKSFENVSFTEYPICTFVDVCTLCSNQRFYICAIYEYLSCQYRCILISVDTEGVREK